MVRGAEKAGRPKLKPGALADEVRRLVFDVVVDPDEDFGEQPEQDELKADEGEEDRDLGQRPVFDENAGIRLESADVAQLKAARG